jgi:hypothetical protein
MLSSKERPINTFAAVRYRDHWFSIENRDIDSKRALGLLIALFRVLAPTGGGAAPILTLPTGSLDCPSINGLFSAGLWSKRVSGCGVHKVRLAANPAAAGCGLAKRKKSSFMNRTLRSVFKRSWMGTNTYFSVLVFRVLGR